MRSEHEAAQAATPALRNPTHAGRVLIVDDEAPTRLLLRDIIEAEGHAVIEATTGEAALELLDDSTNALPDAILLDVLLPGIDGYETCRRMKESAQTAHIPVIVITSLNEREDKLRAIRSGANDYFSKPFDAEDVALRVRNAISLSSLFQEIQTQLRELRELHALRDTLVHMIVHDMRQPITALMGYLQILRSGGNEARNQKFVEICDQLVSRLTMMIDSVLDVQRMETGKIALNLTDVDLNEFTERAVRHFGQSPLYHREVRFEPSPESLQVRVDAEVVTRVLYNLIDNAIKFTPQEQAVAVVLERRGDLIRTSVVDTGPGIEPEYRVLIFEKYGQAKVRAPGIRPSWGLGLAFCKLAVEAHGGTIGVDSEPGKGSTFWFDLPAECNSC